MALYIIIITILYVVFVFSYDSLKAEMRAVGYSRSSWDFDFYMGLAWLVTFNILAARDEVSINGLPWEDGVTSILIKISHLAAFIVFFIVPCIFVFFGLQRRGLSKNVSAALSSTILLITESWFYLKGWLGAIVLF